MKKLFGILLFLILVFSSLDVFAQANVQVYCRNRDAMNRLWMSNVRQFGLQFAPNLRGQLTLSGTYWFNGTNMMRWYGAQMNADNIAQATWAPWVGNFNYGFDDAANNWDRLTLRAAADNLAANQLALEVLSYNLFYDGVNYRRLLGGALADNMVAAPNIVWTGAHNLFYDGANHRRWTGTQMNADNVAAATYAPWVGSFGFGYDAAAGNWDRLTLRAAADNLAAGQVGLEILGYNLFYDGANYRRLLGGALADNLAAAPNIVWTGAHNLFYDGTNHRRWLGDAMDNDGLSVNTVAPHVQSYLHGYDAAAAAWDRLTTHAAGDGLAAAQPGLDVLSYNLYYDGTNYRRLLGGDMADNLAAAQTVPWVGAYNLFYDGTNHRRWLGATLADNLPAAPVAPYTISLGTFYDGTNNRRWLGAQMNSDAVVATTYAPWVGSFGMFFDQENGDWNRDTGDNVSTDATPTTTIAPYRFSLGHIYSTDVDVFTRDMGETADGGTIAVTRTAAYRFNLTYGWDGATWSPGSMVTTHADGLALTLNGLNVAAFLYGYNGATMDLVRLTANGGVQVGQESYPPSEDFGNAQKSVFKKDTNVTVPAEQITATIGTAAVTCLTGRYVLNDVNWCVTVQNTDGVDSMVDIDVEQSPDNAAPWVDLGWATCDTLAPGVACVKCFSGSAYAYVRVQCSALDANQTSSIVTYTANKN